MSKRYTIELDLYAYAETDADINEIAIQLQDNIRKLGNWENHANILTIHETPFGSMEARRVEISKK